jgi:hypothetical protein
LRFSKKTLTAVSEQNASASLCDAVAAPHNAAGGTVSLMGKTLCSANTRKFEVLFSLFSKVFGKVRKPFLQKGFLR